MWYLHAHVKLKNSLLMTFLPFNSLKTCNFEASCLKSYLYDNFRTQHMLPKILSDWGGIYLMIENCPKTWLLNHSLSSKGGRLFVYARALRVCSQEECILTFDLGKMSLIKHLSFITSIFLHTPFRSTPWDPFLENWFQAHFDKARS